MSEIDKNEQSDIFSGLAEQEEQSIHEEYEQDFDMESEGAVFQSNAPFSPALLDSESDLVDGTAQVEAEKEDEDEKIVLEEEAKDVVTEASDSEIFNSEMAKNINVQEQQYLTDQIQAQQQGQGSTTTDVLGIGRVATAGGSVLVTGSKGFGNLVKNLMGASPEKLQAKALIRHDKNSSKLNNLLQGIQDDAAVISGGLVGTTAKSFLENKLDPPVEAMKSAFEHDELSQDAWVGIQSNMESIHKVAKELQASAVQAGIDPTQATEGITKQINDVIDGVSTDLEGVVDGNGHEVDSKLKESMDRLTKMMADLVEKLKSLFSSNDTNDQTMS